jgi:septum formation protein
MPRALILASASPRRRELLAALGIPFVVMPSTVPEIARVGELPAQFARRMAREKAADVAGRHPGSAVIGADTVVVVNGEIFGKPRDAADARRMLEHLSGRAHRVLTAIAVAGSADYVREALVETTVVFRALGVREIDHYIATGEPFDKAGAYAIQGEAAGFVIAVDGSYSNVVGLPVPAVRHLLLDLPLPVP